MDQALARQLGEAGAHEWLIIAGDVALGDHTLSFPLLREVPGRKVLVTGNHDITRASHFHYLDAVNDDGSPLCEAVVPFLCWRSHSDQVVIVSRYPSQLPDHPDSTHELKKGYRALPLLHHHGYLHRDLLPHGPQIQYVNLGWDVTPRTGVPMTELRILVHLDHQPLDLAPEVLFHAALRVASHHASSRQCASVETT